VVATDLDPRFTFDSFIVGPANRLAGGAACGRRAREPLLQQRPPTSRGASTRSSPSRNWKAARWTRIEALAGLENPEEEPAEGSIAGQQLLDEFGSFMEELSHAVAHKVEKEEKPWRRLLRDTAGIFEKDGFSRARLRGMLESDRSPEDSNIEEAAVLWCRALELNPDNASLRTKIDQLEAVAGT
jgi:hypothetical protein